MASCSISAPASAEEGTVVSVSVTVVNTDTERRILRTTVTANEEQIIWVELPFASGESMTFSGSFLMPAGDVTILAWISAYYQELDMWALVGSDGRVVSLEIPTTFHLDVHVPPWAPGGGISPGSGDYAAYSTVMLTAHPFSGYQFLGWGGDASGTDPTYSLYMDGDKYVEAYFEPVLVPEFAGFITRKELDYEDIWQALPLYDIPVDTRTRVRIAGRNDMGTNQKMGIYWSVSDPDGDVVQEYTKWETFWTGPDLEQVFTGSGFDLSKEGKYTIHVQLLMNPDEPQVVDTYVGDLCTVVAVVPESEFRSFALSEYTK